MNLKSKTAIITGASRGLGEACSRALVQKGAKVYGLARSLTKLNKIQRQIGDGFTPVRIDITNATSIQNWVDDTFSKKHFPDILINNAGSGHFGKVDEMQQEKWYSMVDTNINGIFELTSRIVPLMKQAPKSSHIINIGSILGTLGNPEMSGYCATKFAIRGFSEALFKELRYDNIKVSCINPGSIETNFFEDAGVTPHEHMLQPEDIADTVVHILDTPDNMLINEVTIRPLNPKAPGE
jgi:NADP-dependent 3-hydroxy acid dehydrogenase YdfG